MVSPYDAPIFPVNDRRHAQGVPIDVRISPSPTQSDIPHLIDFATRESGRTLDSSAHAYRVQNSCYYSDAYIPEPLICLPPIEQNSGAHRVLMWGEFKGERFVVAVEEIENFFCGYVGEAVYIGTNRCLGEDDSYGLLKGLVLATARVPLFLENDDRGTDYRQKIAFHFLSPDEVERQGCRLSKEAQRCFLIW